ncbi:hypothetical protein MTP99_011956 [Tenebrio molitor]|jgi:hypothetical protein|nr:hypothetical protein MTP99_011956 [Tenebrio molitor]
MVAHVRSRRTHAELLRWNAPPLEPGICEGPNSCFVCPLTRTLEAPAGRERRVQQVVLVSERFAATNRSDISPRRFDAINGDTLIRASDA